MPERLDGGQNEDRPTGIRRRVGSLRASEVAEDPGQLHEGGHLLEFHAVDVPRLEAEIAWVGARVPASAGPASTSALAPRTSLSTRSLVPRSRAKSSRCSDLPRSR